MDCIDVTLWEPFEDEHVDLARILLAGWWGQNDFDIREVMLAAPDPVARAVFGFITATASNKLVEEGERIFKDDEVCDDCKTEAGVMVTCASVP